MTYAEKSYTEIMGMAPALSAEDLTPEERREALHRFFAIMEALPEDRFSSTFMTRRPLNVSILENDTEASTEPAA